MSVPAIFDDGRRFFDSKNHFYGLKKEVAVSAAAPHYALFASKAYPGAVHDYVIHKKEYEKYVGYLLKSPIEKVDARLAGDIDNNSWSMIMDKGYIGPATDTPGLRRIMPAKGPNISAEQRRDNEEISRVRVHVECFFGRLKKMWAIATKRYKYDHSHFDDDIDLCILLTNESIEKTHLLPEESRYYWYVMNKTRIAFEQEQEKIATQKKESAARKRARLSQ